MREVNAHCGPTTAASENASPIRWLINGTTRDSLSADDDGGYFRERAAAYYATGSIALP